MKLMIAACCAAVFWLAWPYWSLFEFAMAVRSGDPVAIEGHVAWPEVRQGLKDDFSAYIATNAAQDEELQDNPFGGLAVALGSAMVEKMVDSYVTPAGLAALVQSRDTSSGAEAATAPTPDDEDNRQTKRGLRNLRWAFFNGPTSFLVVFAGEETGSKKSSVKIVMKFRDFSWKIVRVYIPLDQELAESS